MDGGDRTVFDSPDEALWCKVCAAETTDADPVAKVGTSKGRVEYRYYVLGGIPEVLGGPRAE